MALSDQELADLQAYADRMQGLGNNQQATMGADGYQPIAPQAQAQAQAQDPGLAYLQAYSDRMQALPGSANTVGPQGPPADPGLADLQAYSDRMQALPGSANTPMGGNDPQYAPDADGRGTAHLNFDFGLPGIPESGPIHDAYAGAGGVVSSLARGMAPSDADVSKVKTAVQPALGPVGLNPYSAAAMPPSMQTGMPAIGPAPDAKPQAAAPVQDTSGDQATQPPVIFNGGRPIVIPGGFRDGLRPEERGKFNTGISQVEAAAQSNAPLDAKEKELAGVTERQAILDAAYQKRLADRDTQMGQMLADQKIAQAAKAQTDKEVTAAQEEVRNSGVDPEHFLISRSPLQLIALVLGTLASAMGSALTHTPDNSQQIIDAAINRDINAQVENLHTKKGAVDTALKRALDATGDLDKAKAIVRMQQLTIADDMAHQSEVQAGTAEAKARIGAQRDLIAAGIKEAQGQLHVKNALLAAGTYQQYGPTVIGGAQGVSKDDKETDTRVFKGPDGRAYVAKDSQSRTDLVQRSATVKTVQNLAGRIRNLTNGDWRADPQKRAELESLRVEFQIATGQALELKQMTKDEFGSAGEISGDPKAWLSNGGKIATDFSDRMGGRFKNYLSAQAAEPVQTGYVVDKQGNLQPAARFTGQSPDAGKMPTTQKF